MAEQKREQRARRRFTERELAWIERNLPRVRWWAGVFLEAAVAFYAKHQIVVERVGAREPWTLLLTKNEQSAAGARNSSTTSLST